SGSRTQGYVEDGLQHAPQAGSAGLEVPPAAPAVAGAVRDTPHADCRNAGAFGRSQDGEALHRLDLRAEAGKPLRGRLGCRYARNGDAAHDRNAASAQFGYQHRVGTYAVADARAVGQRDRAAVLEPEFERIFGYCYAVTDGGGTVEGARNPGGNDQIVTAARQRVRDGARRFDRSDAGEKRLGPGGYGKSAQFALDRARQQNHGTPINLCVCSESRNRCG